MAIRQLNPYVHFNGNAAQAIELYERVLGAKRHMVLRYGDVAGANAKEEHTGRILHSELKLGEESLMISDVMPEDNCPTDANIEITLDFTDLDEMTKAFEGLSEGGNVAYPLHDTFYGAKLGMLKDAFGVRWMMNCQLPPKQA